MKVRLFCAFLLSCATFGMPSDVALGAHPATEAWVAEAAAQGDALRRRHGSGPRSAAYDHHRRGGGDTSVHAARDLQLPRLDGRGRLVLPRRRGGESRGGLGDRIRGLASSGRRMERAVPGHRVRGLGRCHPLPAARRGGGRGLRGGGHRQRPHQHERLRRKLVARPPGAAGRLRLPRAARGDCRRQGGHPRLLRPRRRLRLLRRLLAGRSPRPDGGATLSRRLRRHRRRRPCQLLDRPDDRRALGRARHDPRPGAGPSACQAAGARRGGDGGLRRARRAAGRSDR